VAQAYLWAHRYREFTDWAHRRYGSSFTAKVGLLPRSVVTKDREVIRRLMTGDPSSKRHANDLLREALGDRSLLLLEPEEHLVRRKLLSPPFHGERVRAYARLMERLVNSEIDTWTIGSQITMIRVAQRITLDVILEAVLGVSDAAMRNRLRALFDSIIELPGQAVAMYYPSLQRRRRVNLLAEHYYWRKRDVLDSILDEQIAFTRADSDLDRREDILAMMILARDEKGRPLPDTDLRHELNTLIAAGHETTATAIAWAVELLAHNPEVQSRARQAAIEGDQAYLDAAVKEILRIRAPVTVAAARHPLEPFELDGYTIGPETVIIANAWGVHLDPSIHRDPDRFKPERFLEPTPDYGFLPFGGGAHRCLGAALAQLEMKVTVASILARFELRPTGTSLPRAVRRGIVVSPEGGGRVTLAEARPVAQSTAPSTPALSDDRYAGSGAARRHS
jgi:cytochrome P450 family 135